MDTWIGYIRREIETGKALHTAFTVHRMHSELSLSTLVTPPAETIARPFTRLPSRRFKRHSQREEKEAAGTAPDSEPNTEQQRHASSWCFGYSGRPAGASASLSPFCLLSTR